MSTNAAFNPYRPPDEVLADPGGKVRPGGLTTVCVLVIVLGALGLCTGLLQAGGLVLGKQMQQAFQPQQQPGMNDEMFEVQKKMQDEMNAVGDQYFVAQAVLVVIHFVVATMLLVGGLQAMGLKPTGRTILLVVCALAVCYEAVRTTVTVSIQLKTVTIMETNMKKMISTGPQQNAQEVQKITEMAMRVGVVFGFLFTGIIVLVKVLFYVWSFFYLLKPKIKLLFQPAFAVPGRI